MPCVYVWFSSPDVDGIHGPPLVIDGAEFWFVSDKNLSYQEAALYCANNDSDLASVDSYTKLRALLTKIEKVMKYIVPQKLSLLQVFPI